MLDPEAIRRLDPRCLIGVEHIADRSVADRMSIHLKASLSGAF
jgi:hypothetical protein